MRDFSVSDLLPAISLGLGAILWIATASLMPDNGPNPNKAALFDPRLSLGEIISNVSAAGGLVVGTGRYSHIVYVRNLKNNAAPHGLWLTMGTTYIAGCNPKSYRSS